MRARNQPSEDKILFVNDKKAIQSQVYFYIDDDKNNLSNFYQSQAFNNYFGGGFSGIILQEIREYRSLAYSTYGFYRLPSVSDKNGYFKAYIGCQADKTNKAISVLDSLIKKMPQKPERISSLKQNLALKSATQYPNFKNITRYITYYQRQGFTEDPNKEAYQQYKNLTMKEIVNFYNQSIKNKPYIITIYGDKSKIDLEQLKQFGKLEVLNIKDVMKF